MHQMRLEHEQYHGQEPGYQDNNGGWGESHTPYNTSQHQSPVNEYNGFNFNPAPMEPMYPSTMPPPRSTYGLQPLIMPSMPAIPQWPSQLSSQSTYVAPIYPSAPVPVAPASTPVSAVSATPSSATSERSRNTTPRKTLTDADRRRMCLYAEEHPTVKQTEIGAMFGVERSTVSKVLRQKEKYLYQDDGSRSPIKRSKGKFPDIERALSNWVRNAQRQGLPVSDDVIREKARFFATNVGNSDSLLKANSTSWLEKFKQKNNLLGSKSRKSSIAELSENGSHPASAVHTPNGISPTSPSGGASPSPGGLISGQQSEEPKTESPDSYGDFITGHKPFHSQSNPSLSSVFTDTAHSSLSTGATSPTSPLFTPDSASGPSPFIPRGAIPLGSGNTQRPRSQTFPLVGMEQYLSPSSSEALTPKFMNPSALETPESEYPPTLDTLHGSEHIMGPPSQTTSPSSTMAPPPIPAPSSSPPISAPPSHQPSRLATPISTESASPIQPSSDEARRALELVMNFCQHQPSGFVEPQEYITIGKLMEKLRLRRNSEALPGGMHRIPEHELPRKIESL